jgi:hypothetical protein
MMAVMGVPCHSQERVTGRAVVQEHGAGDPPPPLALPLSRKSVSALRASIPNLDFSNYPTLGRARAPVSAVFVVAERGCGRI